MCMTKKMCIAVTIAFFSISPSVFADDDTTSLKDAFLLGKASGTIKSYFFAQTFDGTGKRNSTIWASGGHLKYVTGKFYGARLGGKFQASFIGAKDDPDGKTAGSMDANGAVLSEAYLQYDLWNTRFKGGRQHIKLPLIANSGSRLIKESFEGYFLTNTDIPGTTLSIGWVNKYQTRTDKTRYGDGWFVDYEENGTGRPGDFYDIGSSGIVSFYFKNTSLENLAVQGQYTNVIDEVTGIYTDAIYTFSQTTFQPYVAAQFYYTAYDDPGKSDNSMLGLKSGLNLYGTDIFAGFTTTGGSAGDERVYRGLGQAAYYQYTDTTKTAGVAAFEAGTDSYQVGVAYKYNKTFSSKFRVSRFDNPADNMDLDEYTLNLDYHFDGALENFKISVDFTVLNYENDQKDATDLRSRLIYSF